VARSNVLVVAIRAFVHTFERRTCLARVGERVRARHRRPSERRRGRESGQKRARARQSRRKPASIGRRRWINPSTTAFRERIVVRPRGWKELGVPWCSLPWPNKVPTNTCNRPVRGCVRTVVDSLAIQQRRTFARSVSASAKLRSTRKWKCMSRRWLWKNPSLCSPGHLFRAWWPLQALKKRMHRWKHLSLLLSHRLCSHHRRKKTRMKRPPSRYIRTGVFPATRRWA